VVAGLAAGAAFVVAQPAPQDPVVQPADQAPPADTPVPARGLAELVAPRLAAELSALTGVPVSAAEGRCLADEVLEILGPEGLSASALADRGGPAGLPDAHENRLLHAVVRCLGAERAAVVLRVHAADGPTGVPLPGED
jgi:hypothetical protein